MKEKMKSMSAFINYEGRKNMNKYNVSKSFQMLISRNNHKMDKPQVYIEGKEVSIKKSEQWLGKEIGTKDIFNKKANDKLIARCG